MTLGWVETSITANRREPSGSWKLSSGAAASKRRSVRPMRVATRRTRSISSSSRSTTGGALAPATVAQLEPRRLAAPHVDVLHLGIVEVRLQPAEAHRVGEDSVGHGVLGVEGDRVEAGRQPTFGQPVQLDCDEAAGQLALVVDREAAALTPAARRFGQALPHGAGDLGDEGEVDGGAHWCTVLTCTQVGLGACRGAPVSGSPLRGEQRTVFLRSLRSLIGTRPPGGRPGRRAARPARRPGPGRCATTAGGGGHAVRGGRR